MRTILLGERLESLDGVHWFPASSAEGGFIRFWCWFRWVIDRCPIYYVKAIDRDEGSFTVNYSSGL